MSDTSPDLSAGTSLLQLARHPQPRGWRRRALPREDGRGPRRAGRPRDHLLRRARPRAPRRDPRRRPLRPPRLEDGHLRPRAARCWPRARFGKVDVVVDVQNGLPFFTRLGTRAPVVVLVHHVHREQWPVVYPGLIGRVGWLIEHRFAPRLYRGCQYVAVSTRHPRRARRAGRRPRPHRRRPQRHRPGSRVGSGKTTHPSICVVGRLVPHKQVEHAIDAWADLRRTRPRPPPARRRAPGWWEHELHGLRRARPARRGLTG